MRKMMIVAVMGLGLALSACNMVKGAGRDIESVGSAGERAIK